MKGRYPTPRTLTLPSPWGRGNRSARTQPSSRGRGNRSAPHHATLSLEEREPERPHPTLFLREREPERPHPRSEYGAGSSSLPLQGRGSRTRSLLAGLLHGDPSRE